MKLDDIIDRLKLYKPISKKELTKEPIISLYKKLFGGIKYDELSL